MMACSRVDANLEMVQLLLDKGADPNAKNNAGQSGYMSYFVNIC